VAIYVNRLEFIVGLRQVDNALDQADDAQNRASPSASKKRNDKTDYPRRVVAEVEFVNTERAKEDGEQSGNRLVFRARPTASYGRLLKCDPALDANNLGIVHFCPAIWAKLTRFPGITSARHTSNGIIGDFLTTGSAMHFNFLLFMCFSF
jgi:hypothetical protein